MILVAARAQSARGCCHEQLITHYASLRSPPPSAATPPPAAEAEKEVDYSLRFAPFAAAFGGDAASGGGGREREVDYSLRFAPFAAAFGGDPPQTWPHVAKHDPVLQVRRKRRVRTGGSGGDLRLTFFLATYKKGGRGSAESPYICRTMREQESE